MKLIDRLISVVKDHVAFILGGLGPVIIAVVVLVVAQSLGAEMLVHHAPYPTPSPTVDPRVQWTLLSPTPTMYAPTVEATMVASSKTPDSGLVDAQERQRAQAASPPPTPTPAIVPVGSSNGDWARSILQRHFQPQDIPLAYEVSYCESRHTGIVHVEHMGDGTTAYMVGWFQINSGHFSEPWLQQLVLEMAGPYISVSDALLNPDINSEAAAHMLSVRPGWGDWIATRGGCRHDADY